MNTNTPSSSSSSPLTSPTTFVQADINTFRDLVQKLTGLASDTQRLPVTRALSSSKASRNPDDLTAPRRSPFKLQERRHTLRKLEIKLGLTSLSNSSSSPTRKTHRLDSPVTPLCSGFLSFPSPGTESPSSPAVLEEEKAIAEKGFYFHPSPLNTPRGERATGVTDSVSSEFTEPKYSRLGVERMFKEALNVSAVSCMKFLFWVLKNV